MSSPSSDATSELPGVDERLVAPGSGYEIDDGKLVRVAPSDPPHAELHADLAALLEAHVAANFTVAIDMLTRTSKIDDIAPDASVFPRELDPLTGRRQLEHLAFEIASTQTLTDSGRKARKLSGRGVRRVFAIDVQRARAFEWSRELGTWSILDTSTFIDDPVFAIPLPIAALVRSANTDDVIARALLAKGNPILDAARSEGRAEERIERTLDLLLMVLASRGLDPSVDERALLLRERDLARLDRWVSRVAICATVGELLSTP